MACPFCDENGKSGRTRTHSYRSVRLSALSVGVFWRYLLTEVLDCGIIRFVGCDVLNHCIIQVGRDKRRADNFGCRSGARFLHGLFLWSGKMPKENLKKAKGINENFSAVDTHRVLPKASGGTYDSENYVILDPVAHMQEHGTYRERDEQLEAIKAIVDDRRQVMKLVMKIQNQLLAYERNTDTLNELTEQWLKDQLEAIRKELKARDKLLEKAVKEYAKTDPLTKAALGVRSVGPVTVAHMLTYIDLEKASHASSLWSYVGLDKPASDRYKKGVAGGGNKTLRTVLYTLADSQVKGRGPYREVYDRVKDRLSVSEKVVKSRNTQGKEVEVAWKDTKPCHRHGAALRAVMKHFLADYWMVGRTLAGLDTSPLYPEAMLGGNHRTIMPTERGWVY